MSASEPLSSEIDHLVQPKSKIVETGKRLNPGQKLSDAYYNANLPVVQRRLYQASIRLATLLHEAFPESRQSSRKHPDAKLESTVVVS